MSDIIEICGDKVRAGRIPSVLQRAGPRPTDGSTRFGLFSTLFGPATNQIVVLNRHPGTAPASVFDRRGGDAIDGSGDVMFRERTLALAERDAPYSASGYSLYELRVYDVEVGRTRELVQLMTSNLHFREKYSPNFGVWTPFTGPVERVIHLWAYRDFEHRIRVQEGARSDPDWMAYLDAVRPLITTMAVTVMTPLSGSLLA